MGTLYTEDGMRGCAAHFATRRQATEEIAEYMLFYNRRIIHSSLDYRTSAEFVHDLITLVPKS